MRRTPIVSLAAALLLALAQRGQAAEPAAAKKLLLLGQKPDGHPVATHEYLPGLTLLAKLLEKSPGLQTTLVQADEPWSEGPELLKRADGVVLFLAEGGKWSQSDPRRADALAELARRGGGISVLHWGTGVKDAQLIEPFLKLVGACHGGPDRKYKVVEVEAQVADLQHPVTAGLRNFQVRDEFYYALKRVASEPAIHPLLQVPIAGQAETVAWSWQRPGGGRSFGFTGLHFHESWRLPEYRRLIAQGVLWSLDLPVPPQGLDVAVSDADLKLNGN